MNIRKIFAQLSCSDLDRAEAWYATLFGRGPDAAPMAGLKEWHHAGSAGFQLFRNGADAGHGCLTLIVSDIAGARQRLAGAGMDTGDILSGDVAAILRLQDPDGNAVVLAEPASD